MIPQKHKNFIPDVMWMNLNLTSMMMFDITIHTTVHGTISIETGFGEEGESLRYEHRNNDNIKFLHNILLENAMKRNDKEYDSAKKLLINELKIHAI
ncbi:MAG: hypothetical protein HC836_39420 [Richelia sp. RM2_1_2]|nr:hypothetical protein [Richelia sp. RM2_1_2]